MKKTTKIFAAILSTVIFTTSTMSLSTSAEEINSNNLYSNFGVSKIDTNASYAQSPKYSKVPDCIVSYECWLERGIDHLCYSKSIVYWKTVNGKRIKKGSSKGEQISKGFLIKPVSIKRNKSKGSEKYNHYFNSKTKLVAGITYKGISFGYEDIILDEIHICYDGSSSVREDI